MSCGDRPASRVGDATATLTAEQNVLTVGGAKSQKADGEYLYQGISARPFRRVFNLADYVQVKGASFEQGLLKIDLGARCRRR